MARTTAGRCRVVAVTPFEEPNPALAAAAARAGALGVLDLGRDAQRARRALADTARWARHDGKPATFGVRVPPGCPLGPADLPQQVEAVVLPAPLACSPVGGLWAQGGSGAQPEAQPGDTASSGARRLLIEVTGTGEAEEAGRLPRAWVDGLIARGAEGSGRVGEETTFVLLQRLLGEDGPGLPVWAAGGIGLHTAAAAVAGGAAGVVLDTQLALCAEMDLPPEVAAAIRAMDGSETTVIAGHRVYTRPDLLAATDAVDPASVPSLLGSADLRSGLLPVGQEAAFARPLAEQYGTAGRVIQAFSASIESHLSTAVRARPLAPGSAFATARGTRYPVAQGPMTRVSDRAEFAAAVAGAGGLPFLALALMPGDEVRTLLEATAGMLGGRPWGVGILGFVPAEVRQAQLAVIREIRPPCALIAGGHPGQAAELEEIGIDTFLHVPSPGLLDQFLAAGARRFVFEGRECGGHVGPRASFPLWEAQVERLLAFCRDKERAAGSHGTQAGPQGPAGTGPGRDSTCEVLFAGGIHDERSAAMVAALAAPLAEHGAEVGMLMGSAYLFTEESVASGAITPGFQSAALACKSTALLGTSPGHATRCAETPYVQAFHDARSRLEQAGAPAAEVWAELEQLNLGRLRIASKGLRRRGGDLVPVAEEEQHQDGMYMIGQVAAARSETTTAARLHDQVTDGATAFLAARAAELGSAGPAPGGKPPALAWPAGDGEHSGGAGDSGPADVAIVGMACMFPQAGDLARYWSNVVNGVDAITEVPPERWNAALYYEPDADAAQGRTPSRWGGFLPEVPFDPLSYGIPPASLASVEPVQLLALETASRALADAGYAQREFDRTRTSVIFGAEAGSDLAGAYGFRSLHPSYLGGLPPALDEQLPKLTEDSFAGVLANVIAGRIANRLDLGGVNYTVDAACAASLAALDLACKELRAGSSDMVLTGGADVHNGIHDFLLFASVRALSPSGRCKPFDRAADGIALGEGVACVVLKRLADAERDGDRVYAVIKAVAGSSDGRSLGLTAPNTAGQSRALRRAYQTAQVPPAQVGLFEAHGTGTTVGDRTELATLTELFTEAGASPASCALGSVKSQIGHTKCAAGLAGLIKTAYAVYAGVRPPSLHLNEPNAFFDEQTSPFCFDRSPRPWPAPPERRVAGVSAFGFGGTNFHAVLAGYDGAPEPSHGLREWPAELFVVRGRDRAAAVAKLDRLAELIAGSHSTAGGPPRLRDIAATFAQWQAPAAPGGDGEPVQAAFVVGDVGELDERLAAAREFRTDRRRGVFAASEDGSTGRVAFLFPGQGSQRPGMLADLFIAFPRLAHLLREGGRWADAMFPPAAFAPEQRQRQLDLLTDTRTAQPALGIAGLAVRELLAWLGVTPDDVAGHSYGELVALCAAGALPADGLLPLSELRGTAILEAAGTDPGAMAAVAAGAESVSAALGQDTSSAGVVIANHNGPAQTVISGPTAAVGEAVEALQAAGLTARRLPVACAFHSPLVSGAAGRLAGELGRLDIQPPAIDAWSNATAARYPRDPGQIRALLARQVAEPVQFAAQVEAMYEAGARVFIEAGPGRVLTQLTGKILGDRPHTAVATDVPGENGLRRLLLALAELAAAGVPVDLRPLFAGRDAKPVEAATSGGKRVWLINGHLIRAADGSYPPGGLRPATPLPGNSNPVPAPPVPADGHSTRGSDGLEGHGPSDGLDGRRADGHELDGRGAEGRAVDRRGLDGHGLDGHGLDGHGLDGHGLDGHGLDGRGVEANGVDGRALDGRGLDGHGLDGRGLDGHDLDGRGVEANGVDRRALDRHGADGHALDGPSNGARGPDSREAAVIEFLRGTREMIAAQRDVLLSLLGTPGGPPPPGPVMYQPAAAPAPQVTRAVPDPEPGREPEPDRELEPVRTQYSQEELLQLLVTIVGERTGYPTDMLEPDLDLEADLSIDSIKRLEIIGELGSRAGLDDADPPPVEELARIRTLRGIAEWFAGRTEAGAGPGPAAADGQGDSGRGLAVADERGDDGPGPAAADGLGDGGRGPAAADGRGDGVSGSGHTQQQPDVAAAGVPDHAQRYIVEAAAVEPVRVDADAATLLRGRQYVIAGAAAGTGVADRLAELIEGGGGTVRAIEPGPPPQAQAGADGIIHLGALDPGAPPLLPGAYQLIRDAVTGGARQILVATASAGPGPDSATVGEATGAERGAGAAGLIRTIAHEYPDAAARVVCVDPGSAPGTIARQLVAELARTGPGLPPVVAYRDGAPVTPRLIPAPLDPADSPDLAPLAAAAGLGPESVVLLTGGARGITAQLAIALAATAGCHIELIGRSPAPGTGTGAGTAVDRAIQEVDGAAPRGAGRAEIRRALIEAGLTKPADVEHAADRLLAGREIGATLETLARTAASARYHRADVRDAAAIRAVVDDTYARHGRIDGVVHGAGVLDDKLVTDKTPESFARVYSTKVDGARALAAALRRAEPGPDLKFFVLLSSISGVLGNPGQADYAAANDALDTFARTWSRRFRGRMVALDWGPWEPGPGGMVTPELERAYRRRGFGTIHADDGVRCLLKELASGGTQPQVVYARASAEALHAGDATQDGAGNRALVAAADG